MDSPEAVFGVVAIKAVCSKGKCGGTATAVFPVRTPQETGIWWLCDEHASELPHGAREVTRTCGAGDQDVPSGAFATHIAMVGVRDDLGNPVLGIVSICSRHASQMAQPDG